MQLQHIVITATQCNDYECNTLGLCYTHITATHCNCNTLVSLQRPDDARLQILANNTGGWAGVEQAHCNTVQLRHTVITATLCNCNILISLQRTDSAHAYRFWRRRQGGGLVWSRQRHCGASYSRTLRLCLLHSTPAGRCGVCCSVLQCVAVCCSVQHCNAVCCSVLQCVAVCCSVLQCVAVCCRVLQMQLQSCSRTPRLSLPSSQTESSSYHKLCRLITTNFIVCDSSVLQCVAVCCSVLQCVAVSLLYCISTTSSIVSVELKKEGIYTIEFAVSSATCHSVLQRVAACWQFDGRDRTLSSAKCWIVLQCVAACCSVLAVK